MALRVAAVRLKAQTLVVIDETDRPCSTVLADGLTARLRALSPAMVGEDGNAPTVDSIGVSATMVLVPKLTRYSYLRRVADLASATGWPVVGVLGTPARAGRGQS